MTQRSRKPTKRRTKRNTITSISVSVSKQINEYGLLFYETRDEQYFNKIFNLLYQLIPPAIQKYYKQGGNKAVQRADLYGVVISEVGLAIWRNINSFNPKYKFNTWIRPMIFHKYMQQIQRDKISKNHTRVLVNEINDFISADIDENDAYMAWPQLTTQPDICHNYDLDLLRKIIQQRWPKHAHYLEHVAQKRMTTREYIVVYNLTPGEVANIRREVQNIVKMFINNEF
jgi:DNA-directed RNA polymerase specialized sigma24 family protein